MNRYYEHPTEKNFRSPVYNVRAVPVEKIVANSYNPNVVAPPEMKLLELSIWEDGYTMPCVCYYDAERDCYELVDGYHRYLVLKTSKRIYERERGLLPVTVSEGMLKKIFEAVERDPATQLKIDLPAQTIQIVGTPFSESFEITAYKKQCLMNGYDDVDYLVSIRDQIADFERTHHCGPQR